VLALLLLLLLLLTANLDLQDDFLRLKQLLFTTTCPC
jgi:hypothetical protein